MNTPTRRHPRPGFAFVELLVVIGIIGVLTGLAAPAVLGVRQSSTINAAMTDLRAVDVAVSSDCAQAGRCGWYLAGYSAINRAVPDALKAYLPLGFKFRQDTSAYAFEMETFMYSGGHNPLYPLCRARCMAALLQPTWSSDTLGFSNSIGFTTPQTIYVSINIITRNPDVAQSLYTRAGGSPPVYIASKNVWKFTYPVLVGVPATG